MRPTPIRHRKPSEEGYILVVVMFMLAVFLIALAVAVPVVRKDIQRDREIETMHRGKQYVRAVKLYYKKFGAYPSSVDALVMTNEIRFLRKKYIDPTTGKDEWKIIRFGQNKTQTLGFFGQPIGSAGAGGGLCGNALPGSTPTTSSPPGSGSMLSSGSSGTGLGTSSAATSGCPDTTAPSTAGTASSATTVSTDPTAISGSSASGSSTGLTGQTFGGGPMIGVSPNSPKQSILLYKKKNHYNEWEFFYDPIADQMMMQGGNVGNAGLTPTPSPTPTPTPTPPAPQPQQ